VASTALGDYGAAIGFVEIAMNANPGDPRLTAELLYCKASAGDVEEAENLLPVLSRLIATSQVDRTREAWDMILAADQGLIAFRRGDREMGSAFYRHALDIASANELREFGASAFINFAREEALANPGIRPDADALQRAVDAFPVPTRGVTASFVRRILEQQPGIPRRHTTADNAPS
jgi:tetratricopeptide (TPR) repeat protein